MREPDGKSRPPHGWIAHFLGRALEQQGHEVRLIPAQYVKPYVKNNKSDYFDAEAIAEAVGRPTMRFVPIKSDDQLDLQSLHRVRERWNAGSRCARAGAMSTKRYPESSKMRMRSCREHYVCC